MLLETFQSLRGRLQFCQRRSPVAFLDERSTVIDEFVDVAAAQLFSGSGSVFFLLRRHGSVTGSTTALASRGLQRCPLCVRLSEGRMGSRSKARSSRARHRDARTLGAATARLWTLR